MTRQFQTTADQEAKLAELLQDYNDQNPQAQAPGVDAMVQGLADSLIAEKHEAMRARRVLNVRNALAAAPLSKIIEAEQLLG